MSRPVLSLVLPYERRLHNLTLCLRGLLGQTMDPADFEVVIGTTKYDTDYLDLARAVAAKLNLVTVLTDGRFEIPRARNMAMRQATGSVVVNIDADTLLPPDALVNLFDRHYAGGQEHCVVGQVVGYGNNYDGDVTHVEPEPFEIWQDRLAELGTTAERPRDARFQVEHVIPWSFAWTGLIALPRRALHENDLFFDESFVGWGVDDIEWGYRIDRAAIPIVLRRDVYALHLPHVRDSAANFASEAITYQQFLAKWPGHDVELAAAFSDVEANELYQDFQAGVRAALPPGAHRLGTVRGTEDGAPVLVVGVPLDEAGRMVGELPAALDPDRPADILPLVGMALPDADGSATVCRVLAPARRLPARYADKVLATAHRVAGTVVVEPL
jgi:GT2 family glycosyltransferase